MTCAHSVRVLIALVAGLAVSGCGGGGGATGAGVDSAAAGSSDAGGEVHTARDVPGDDGVVEVSEGDQGDVGGGLPDGGGPMPRPDRLPVFEVAGGGAVPPVAGAGLPCPFPGFTGTGGPRL